MARRKRAYRSRWLLAPAVAVSLTAQGAGVVAYEETRPTPKPSLSIHFDGEGYGQVLVTRVGDQAPLVRCNHLEPTDAFAGLSGVPRVTAAADLVASALRRGPETPTKTAVIDGTTCRIDVEPGTKIQLSAVLGDDATFGGFHQLPMRTPKQLVPYLGDPLANCTTDDLTADVLECPITITADTSVSAEFGAQPEEIDVALTDEPPTDVPTPITAIKEPKTQAQIDAEKLDQPLQVALAPPPPPPLTLIKPPPPQPDEPPPPPPKPVEPPPNMVMVEVKDDKHVVDKAPDDATKLSDKNRDTEEETRATETNLDKESEGKQVASKESDDRTSTEIGGPDDKIRQLEDTKPTTDQHLEDTDHSGKSETAKGVIVGEGGDNGDEGTGPKDPGVLSMRGIEGRGALQDQGHDGRKAGRKGTIGVNTPLAFQDYERIMGKEKIDDERQVAARKMSSHKGRWEKKLAAVKSSLENFVPDVRAGNQTALKTRAHPFAVYVARMHRRIHELWGFGFLESLDDKGADYPLNNQDLWVNLELSVNPDGSIHKVTIAKTSGKTEFDVAAVDTVISSAPYEPTPEAIRSVDGRIYLRWGFYRNWRQCGTFNVEPYILTDVPDDGGVGALDDGAMVANTAKLPGKKRALTSGTLVTPDDGKEKEQVSPTTSVTDKQALFAANRWVSAFATASVDKLVKYSTVPFYAGGKIAAQTQADLKDMFSGLVVESGPMKDWKLLQPNEYASGSGSGALPEGNVVLQVRTAKEAFAVVLTRTKSGEYRATQLAR